jgi:predicted nucleic acid-binding protein
VTGIKVVDASALGAVLFNEPEADSVSAWLRGGQLVAPVLLEFEIANVCLTKIRRHADQREGLLAAYRMFRDFSVEFVEIDYFGALDLAEVTRLTFYDASYLWLAQRLAAELITLDKILHAAWSSRPHAD